MKILVVVDMQNDFIAGSLGTAEAKKIVERVIGKIAAADYDALYYTMDSHGSDYLNTQEGTYLPVAHCIEGTDGESLFPGVFASDGIVVKKNTFGSKKLMEEIAKCPQPIHEIELIGVCTDICVISNAILFKVFFPDTRITVDASCCAGVTPEKHKEALSIMKSCQIDITNE